MAKLITETDFRKYKVIMEDSTSDKPKTIKLRGIYIQCDKENGNNRIYDYDMMKPEVDSFITDYVNQGRALGQLEHPDYAEINPNEAAIRITSLKDTGNNSWTGESIVLASDPKHGIKGTPKGDILASLIQYGTKVGFSTRGVGDVQEDDDSDMPAKVTNYHLCTIDCVVNPSIGLFCDSNGNRCVNGILESKDFMINTHGDIMEHNYHRFEKKLSKLPRLTEEKNKKVARAVREFLDSLVL